MPVHLTGSCRCGAVKFSCDSHTPQPYQRCYCSICRKTAGGGGYAINLGADARTLKIDDPHKAIQVSGPKSARTTEPANGRPPSGISVRGARPRSGYFRRNGPTSCIRSLPSSTVNLPAPPSSVHLMLRYKPSWVQPDIGADDAVFELYPDQSIEDWHRSRGLWVD